LAFEAMSGKCPAMAMPPRGVSCGGLGARDPGHRLGGLRLEAWYPCAIGVQSDYDGSMPETVRNAALEVFDDGKDRLRSMLPRKP
jgi:hypothetical protein